MKWKKNNPKNLQVSVWRNFCTNRCEHFINIFPEYFKLIQDSSVNDVYKKYFIQEDFHFNVEGNRLLAKLIAKFNLNQSILLQSNEAKK